MFSFLFAILKRPYLAIAYSLFVLGLCVMPSEELPGDVDDKLAHFIAFAGVSFLWLWASENRILVIALSILFGVAVEFIQGALPVHFHRSFDWYDALADGIGVIIGFLLFLVFRKIEKSLS